MVVAIVTMFSCSKKGDPTPAQKTALDSVKLAMTGKWVFKSVTVTQISSGKSATTSTCAQSELYGAGFTNNNWQYFVGTLNFTYNSAASTVNMDTPCTNNNIPVILTFNIIQVSSGVFNIQFSNIGNANYATFQVKSSDLKTSYITATLISWGIGSLKDYLTIYHFTKQ